MDILKITKQNKIGNGGITTIIPKDVKLELNLGEKDKLVWLKKGGDIVLSTTSKLEIKNV